jgi:ankyrin repeat protein
LWCFFAHLRGYKFCHAASNGNLAEINNLVLSGADINTGDYDGRTALHIAACTGNLELVKYIIANGMIPTSFLEFHSFRRSHT